MFKLRMVNDDNNNLSIFIEYDDKISKLTDSEIEEIKKRSTELALYIVNCLPKTNS